MKKVQLATLLFFVVALISCDKDEEPVPQDFFTYTLEVDQDWWMVAHSPDGNLLGFKKLVYQQPVSLTVANPPDSFSLTLVRSFESLLDVTTYGGIKRGSVFAPKLYLPAEFTPAQLAGKGTVQVSNYPINDSYPLIVSDPYQSAFYYSSGKSVVPFEVSVWKDQAPKMFITGYKNDFLHPVYKFVDPVKVGATVTADFTTFTEYPKTLDLTSFNSQGLETSVIVQFDMYNTLQNDYLGYHISDVSWEYTGVSPTVRVGVPVEFNKVYIDLTATEVSQATSGIERAMTFTRLGVMPTEIKFLHDNFEMAGSLGSFDFTFDGVYQVKSQSYSSGVGLSWSVFSGVGAAPMIPGMPSELLTMFPSLDPSKIVYGTSTFNTYPDGHTYAKMIDEIFTTSFAPAHPGYSQTFVK